MSLVRQAILTHGQHWIADTVLFNFWLHIQWGWNLNFTVFYLFPPFSFLAFSTFSTFFPTNNILSSSPTQFHSILVRIFNITARLVQRIDNSSFHNVSHFPCFASTFLLFRSNKHFRFVSSLV